jgi:hypothetical protein
MAINLPFKMCRITPLRTLIVYWFHSPSFTQAS